MESIKREILSDVEYEGYLSERKNIFALLTDIKLEGERRTEPSKSVGVHAMQKEITADFSDLVVKLLKEFFGFDASERPRLVVLDLCSYTRLKQPWKISAILDSLGSDYKDTFCVSGRGWIINCIAENSKRIFTHCWDNVAEALKKDASEEVLRNFYSRMADAFWATKVFYGLDPFEKGYTNVTRKYLFDAKFDLDLNRFDLDLTEIVITQNKGKTND